jgi:hypothetical protein
MTTIGGLVCALGMTAAGVASAQERSGIKVGIGGGVGSSSFTCRDCSEEERETGSSASFTIGYHISPRVRLGMDANLWAKTYEFLDLDADATASLYSVVGSVTFYPAPRGGFFIKAGAGGSFVNMDFDVDGSKLSADLGRGLGLMAAAGYDIRVSRRVAITPAVNVWAGRPGTLKLLGDTLFEDARFNVVDFTVGVTFP